MKHFIITGGTGFIGQKLTTQLIQRGDHVTILSRSITGKVSEGVRYETYDGDLTGLMEGADAVINLAGENLFNSRWTASLKKRIISSRVDTTNRLVQAMEKANHKPDVFVSASAVGYYGNRGDELLTESSEPGNDFLADVCVQWESAAIKAKELGVRVVLPRIGIALETGGGALGKMLLPFNLFIGGPLGDGSQYFPWIHMDDLCSILIYMADNDRLDGAFNASAPDPVTMKQLSKILGKVLNRPSFFSVPEFALKLVLGESAKPVLSSHRVASGKLQKSGYKFLYTDLEAALRNLIDKS